MSRVAPIAPHERIADIDVLRGFALLGVFLSNLVSFAGGSVMADSSQLALLPSAWWDSLVNLGLGWLVDDKANTLFALLFGVGLAIQQQRASRKGADPSVLLTRRMLVLLAFGVLHLFFLWPWDVLHVYALAGLVLIPLSKLSNRGLLLVGLPLAFFGREFATLIHMMLGDGPMGYGDEQALVRQELSAAGNYLALMGNFAQLTVKDHLARGDMVAWVLYAIGRAMVGIWLGRKALLMNTERRRRGFVIVLWSCLPAGLLLAGLAQYLQWASASGRMAETVMQYGELLHRLSSPVLAAGYVAAVVLALQSRAGKFVLAPLASAGRMAFTNYVMQSGMTLLVLTGVGPGLALAGYVGALECTAIVFACFALQVAFSRLWLSHFTQGPLEWVWRSLTYGRAVPQHSNSRDLTGLRSSPR